MRPSSGSISIATSKRKLTSSPRSLATRSMVLTRENLVYVHGSGRERRDGLRPRPQFQGSSSSSRCAGWPAMRERTSASHVCGSTPFIFAVTTRLYMAAARCPRSGPQNSDDFRPKATPRSPLSPALLTGMVPATLLFRLAFMPRGSHEWTTGLGASGARNGGRPSYP